MAEIIQSKKALAVNPLKVSQPVGASLAFLGLARSLPLMHGSQGCTAFGKVFFVRHFREPIPLQTTAMDQVSTIMGADENIVEALRTLSDKSKPDIIGLVTTGLSETQGTDILRSVKALTIRSAQGNLRLAEVQAVMQALRAHCGEDVPMLFDTDAHPRIGERLQVSLWAMRNQV